MLRSVLQQHPERILKPLPLISGGTNAKTASEAIANLNGIAVSRKGQANGVAPLNGAGKIPLQYLPAPDVYSVSVTGPSHCYLGRNINYTITDYDSDTTYPVSCSSGIISINKDIITYKATELGNHIFTVKDNTYDVNCISAPTPIILTPTAYSIIFGNSVFTLSLEDVLNDPGHLPLDSLEWQISTDIDFNNIIITHTDQGPVEGGFYDGAWYPVGLPLSTSCHVRVRLNPPNETPGEWSPVVHFSTKDVLIPIYYSDSQRKGAYLDFPSKFGYNSTALSGDGNIYATTDISSDETEYLKVNIFRRNNQLNGNLEFQTSIDIPSVPNISNSSSNYFNINWRFIALSQTGDKLFIGYNAFSEENAENLLCGAIYYFTTTVSGQYDDYTFQQLILPNVRINDGHFGANFVVSNDGNRLFVVNGETDKTIEIFENVNDVFSHVDTIVDPGITPSDTFGGGISISSNGNRLVVNDFLLTSTVVNDSRIDNYGRIYIYDYANSAWSLTQSIEKTYTPDHTGEYSVSIGKQWESNDIISANGQYIFFIYTIKEFDQITSDFIFIKNLIFIYEIVNDVWTEKQIIENVNWNGGINTPWLVYIRSSGDGKILLVGTPESDDVYYPGQCYLYAEQNGIWELANIYQPPYTPSELSGYTSLCFGEMAEISSAGDEVIISCTGFEYTNSQNDICSGEVKVYTLYPD